MPNRLKVQKPKGGAPVIVRFAPEPSGYIHIGHAKPLFLNDIIREDFDGKFIVRFDDTNPTKESDDFKDAILEDITERLGVKIDDITYTSNYFDLIIDYARKLIVDGNAYMDNTPFAEMKLQRENKEPSPYRNMSVEDNLAIFDEFVKDNKSEWCMRAKISYNNVNGCLRDPVFMRACDTPHMRFGTDYSVYPVYDFCCPITDHLDGITHALRANEYIDHQDIYKWVCKKLGLVQPHIVHFSKIRFEHTIMSKRHLKTLVENGAVSGWDDPRMPTIRGLLNRGLQPEVLKKYIVDMGLNNKISLTTWTKLWGSNKKFIDRIIPRYSSVNVDGAIKLTIDGIDDELVEYDAPLHSTNKSLGTRIAYRSNKLILNRYDTDLMEVGDRVGLLRYVVVEVTKKNDDGLVCVVPDDQSFKNTKHKVNWLVDDSKTYKEVELVTYDDLITKPSMEKGDNIMDIFNIDSKKTERVYVEINMNVDVGKSLQLERRGYYICSVSGMTQIPDSRAKAMIN